jgi:hypothetical protein
VAELLHQAADEPGEAARTGRPPGQRRAADTGDVEGDHPDRGVQGLDERHQEVEAGPDAVAQQERRLSRLPPRHQTLRSWPPTVTIWPVNAASCGLIRRLPKQVDSRWGHLSPRGASAAGPVQRVSRSAFAQSLVQMSTRLSIVVSCSAMQNVLYAVRLTIADSAGAAW